MVGVLPVQLHWFQAVLTARKKSVTVVGAGIQFHVFAGTCLHAVSALLESSTVTGNIGEKYTTSVAHQFCLLCS